MCECELEATGVALSHTCVCVCECELDATGVAQHGKKQAQYAALFDAKQAIDSPHSHTRVLSTD